VIELAKLLSIEDDFARLLAIEAYGHLPIVDCSNGAQIPVGDAERLTGFSELNAVSCREFARFFHEDVDATQPARIVADR